MERIGNEKMLMDRPGFEPGTSRMPTEHTYDRHETGVGQLSYAQSNASPTVEPNAPVFSSSKVSLKEIFDVVDPAEWLQWMKLRYSSRGHAIYCYTSAKYLPKIAENPALLKTLSYRRARGVLVAIGALRDFLKIRYNAELEVDTKFLRKFMPPRPVEEVTNAILEYELRENKEIVDQAVEALNKIAGKKSKLALPTIIAFFTGLRATEIRYMLMRWNELKKINLGNVVLVELNYDRVKKKAYITLLPKEIAAKIKPIVLGADWRNHLLHKHGIRLGMFRKAWIAITSRHLDSAERDLLQGRLKSIQVRHYVKHIRNIAERYYEAFKQYVPLINALQTLEDTGSQGLS